MTIAVDASTPAYVALGSGVTGGTTASFTPPAGSLLVLPWSSSVNRTLASISGSPTLSWLTLINFAGANGGDEDVELWIADGTGVATTVTGNTQVTGGTGQAAFGVVVLTGTAPANMQNGATNKANAASGTPSGSLTTAFDNSQVIAALAARGGIAPTVPGGQTDTFNAHVFLDASNNQWAQAASSPTASAGTAVTINDTGISNEWAMVLAEILAPPSPTHPPANVTAEMSARYR